MLQPLEENESPILSFDPDTWLQKLNDETEITKWLNTEKDYITEFALPEAKRLSISPEATGQQIKHLGGLIALIADETTRGIYYDILADQWPVFKKNFKRPAVEKKKEAAAPATDRKRSRDNEWSFTIINFENQIEYITDKMNDEQKESVMKYRFVEWNKAYYFGALDRETQTATLVQQSNFAMRILYHIKRSKNKNKRVVAIYNSERSEVLDIDTKQLVSLQAFKELTEGAGDFLFKGDNNDLMYLKVKLMREEKPCIQLDTLGWQSKGFFAFSNGIIKENQFEPVDEFGIVSFKNSNYFIPYHPGTEETSNLNEKRFAWKPSDITWKQWSKQYYKVFGQAGMVTMIFGAATVFSDHIFYIRTNFPMLFFYGEGGSGKSKMVQFIQHWFGTPQPAIKVSEKANTDKGKIRKMAQFSNALVCFEEFLNSSTDMSVTKTFTGFYDRYGYERSDIDSKYGTETVPVQSTVCFIGNEYPGDDPLFQRMIIVDHNVNEFTADQEARYDELQKMNRKGLTQILLHLLQYRDRVVADWEEFYERSVKQFKAVCGDLKVPSRMIENSAVLLATHDVLAYHGMEFPFRADQLISFLHTVIKSQAEKRDTGGAVQRFWDIVVHLLKKKTIVPGKDLILDGDELMIRIGEVHTYYLSEHFLIHRQQGLNKTSLMQKLRDSPAYVESLKSARFAEVNTSCFVFDVKRITADISFNVWTNTVKDPADPAQMTLADAKKRQYKENE